jgi:hypothetical protein
MSHSQNQDEEETVSKGRLFEVVEITDDDLRRAKEIPSDACPRRYCWWWASLSFDWNVPVKDGCTVVESDDLPPKYRHIPCCRSERSSPIDHFEPRVPHILEDGIDASRWLKRRFQENKEGLLHLKRILDSPDADSLRNFGIVILALPDDESTDWKNRLRKWVSEQLAVC